MNLTLKQIASIGIDLVIVVIAYVIGHWIGFALAVVVIALLYALQALQHLQTIQHVLLSRLTDRCAMCRREIVDDGGTLANDFEGEIKIYHEVCAEKLDALKEKEKL
jgi:hypothetical protein